MKKEIRLSKHASDQMIRRGISEAIIWQVLEQPLSVNKQGEIVVYHGIYEEDKKRYLIRIFVNETQIPAVIVTVYKTSKLEKYL